MTARDELRAALDAIEGAYEFFLAYAAQGISTESEGSRVAGQFRRYVDGMAGAVDRIPSLLDRLVEEEDVTAPERLRAFGEVLKADALRASAAIEVVRAQTFATSQLVDNLNASVHVRTLLTDTFLLDELLGLGVDTSEEAKAPGPA
jgi:hypothetical protein